MEFLVCFLPSDRVVIKVNLFLFATLQLLANNVFSYDMACAVGVPWMIGFAAIALVPAAFIFWFAYWWKDRKRAYLPRVAKVFLSLNVSFRFVSFRDFI